MLKDAGEGTINRSGRFQGLGLNLGGEITGDQQALCLSGRSLSGPDRAPMHADDLIGQLKLSWPDLKDSLADDARIVDACTLD